ncbi:MAG: hypothetical protein VX615_03710 [Planctomycetota bacterium]|nr:hypothetical protein [Planctomycetota bacterium]
MRTVLAFIMIGFWALGCAPETTAPTPQGQDDLLDLTKWDFGDVDVDEMPSQIGRTYEDDAVYAIAVVTFSGIGHQESAKKALASLSMQYPRLVQQLQVRDRSRGSVLAFGSYDGYDDPNVARDIDTLKRIVNPQGKPLFGQIFISKFRTPLAQRRLHPHDLWSVRKEFPTIVPIYTLEVAVWGDFGGGQFPKSKRRAAAESFASELRARGNEAFFYHNDDRDISSVTVGLFGYNAVDASTGFYSPEVDAMIALFPERLVNGEQVLEYLDPMNQSFGTRVQQPILAEVPVD